MKKFNELVDVFGNPISSTIENGYQDSLGIYQFNPFGFPGNESFPGSAPVEQVNTVFTNLRWYLVSNFMQVLNQAYAEIGLVSTVVDVPCDDAFRGGIDIKSKQLSEDEIAELQLSLDRDDNINNVNQAQKWNRLFGGAGILILTDQDPEEPFDINAIDKNTPIEFRPVDLWELFWDKQNTEGYDPSIQVEDIEFYNYYASQIHKTRVMKLKGITPPSFIRPRLRGWGLSVVEILIRSINQYLKATDLGFEVLDEFKVDYYKIKNLVNTLMSPIADQKIQQRISQMNRQKNFMNAVVMDKEDEWNQKQLSFAGLAETMQGVRMQVAADMRMPITKLFGTSASAGIGNTDQNDMENYNSMVESQVRNKSKYELLRICEIKCQKLFGSVPTDLSISFKPLRVLTAEQEENVKTQKSNRITTWQTAGLLSTIEAREAANKGNLFDISLDTTQDDLNPDDPQVEDIVEETDHDAADSSDDIDDPGANREDTRKVRAWDAGGIAKGLVKGNPSKKPGSDNMKVRNSAEFDRKSFEADGGENWIDDDRARAVNPEASWVDKAVWAQAAQREKAAYPEGNKKFAIWMYSKLTGRKI